MTGAWELVAALGAGALAGRRAGHPVLVRLVVTTLAWTAIDLARGHFPVGSFGLETLATAALVRVTASEVLAGLASRLVFVALAWGALALAASGLRLGAKLRRRLASSAALLLLAVAACREPAPSLKTYFTPAAPGDTSEIVQPILDDPTRKPATHPPLPPDLRTSSTCLACHSAIVAPGQPSRARKGFHEIHAANADGEPGCLRCHASAGAPAFPGEYPGLHVRREANQACAGCHSQQGAPFWRRAVR